jgi:transcriptional regulator with XRE-family HTH domain
MTARAAIEQILEQAGLSKAELSRRSGVSRAQIDTYLKGRSQPSVAQLARLGAAAGLRLELSWSPTAASDPSWLKPDNPAMAPPPLTLAQRAEVLERVVPVAMAQRRRARGELQMPPFRSLLAG